ncbi:MAG: Si-specific NAD(P)(+) transhydrogenase [Bdellovibrionales bacterium]|nr:Si-specific NAD(P)(+) transhydrogenase [Bdellovibrionales bacterium]
MNEIHTGGEKYDFDLVVIGSGPGGQRAAVQAAKSGKKVALIEKSEQMGGACVHYGTLPSKSLRESVYRWSLGSKGILGRIDHGAGMSEFNPDVLPDMARLMRRKERVIDNESKIVDEQLKRNKVQVFRGAGRFSGDHEVKVVHADNTASILKAQFAVIAVGARPIKPQYARGKLPFVLDSDTILQLKKTPKTMIVLGAGIIGCEYASIFQAAGTHVTLIDKRQEILSSVDREIVFHLVDRFMSLGMDIILEAETQSMEVTPNGGKITLNSGTTLEAEHCLVAMGRQGNTEDLGLDKVGIVADARGQIKVGPRYQTTAPWIYGVGDVIGFPALASTAMEQGRIAVCDAFKITEQLSGFEVYPYGIYTIPEISTIGKSEEELLEKMIPFVVGRSRYKEIARGQIVGDDWGMLKLLVHRDTMQILGVHIIGDNAADLIHIGQAVMQLGGDLKYFIRSVFNYPTLAEAYKTAAFNAYNQILGRPSHD